LLRWEAAQLGVLPVGGALGRAIAATHVGYFRLGAMVQGLVWEAYRAPVTLPDLLAGNSDKVSLAPNAVARIAPPSPADAAAWMNKTGSTNGFSAYVAFAPGAKAGVVVLANKRFPIAARVRAGWEILTRLTTAPWRPGARAGN
jgi:beta-lactamase class C